MSICQQNVCLSVCLSVREHIFGTTCHIFTNFLCILPMVVHLLSFGGVTYVMGWLGGRVVIVLDSGPVFKSQPQTVHTHRASVHEATKSAAALFRVAMVTAGLAKSNGSLPSAYDSRHLQADSKNENQLRNPTLSNRVWATFTFFNVRHVFDILLSVQRNLKSNSILSHVLFR